jgi:hypothetical protein
MYPRSSPRPWTIITALRGHRIVGLQHMTWMHQLRCKKMRILFFGLWVWLIGTTISTSAIVAPGDTTSNRNLT